ncbi:sensor histidine kinase [Lacinutrix mariniflava]|uniref:sensor histidine kinase n=1 Tax=Lacinutrix mariniflava TaxID=342955 RepID=UPI0009F8EAF1|nr:HAMP domain-containing sensor histidine kinase [Lacinutrix mariniflava]
MFNSTSNNILSNEIHDKDFLNVIENSLAIGSWELDIKSNILKWSSVTRKIHEVEDSYVPDVTTGLNFYKAGANRELISKHFTECLTNGKSFDDELLLITAKGNEKWVRTIGHSKLEDGVCIAVRGVFQDITKKTVAAKKTAIKEKEFRSMFENSLTGMAIVSLTGKLLNVNNSICNILGYTKEDFLDLGYEDFTHPEDKNIAKKEVKLMLSGKIDHFRIEKRYIHKNGTIIHSILSVTIVRDTNGLPQHFISNIIDVSDIKTAKNDITELLTISSKQNDRLLNFAHIVSHNLRSHGSNLDMLLQLKKDDSPEIMNDEYFQLYEKAVDNLNETINNLNEVAIHNSLSNDDLQSLNLLQFTNNAISNINALILSNEADINVIIDEKITVKGIPAYLDSIIINFLTNAIKYKKLDINPKITLEAKQNDDAIILSITDNGQGINLEKHGDRLFGMYNVFHKHKDSRGLGLFIVKNQIEAIGGKVEVDSTVGKGTNFKIHFTYK